LTARLADDQVVGNPLFDSRSGNALLGKPAQFEINLPVTKDL